MMSDKQKKELGIYKVRFYTHRTPLVNNIYTVCILISEDKEVLSRGISVCSMIDVYNKKDGKNRAFGRAIAAMRHEKDMHPLSFDDCRWRGEAICKSFKIKTPDNENYFQTHIVPILSDEICEEYKIVDIKTKDGSPRKKVYFAIPRIYPIYETMKDFQFKAYFRPELNDTEEAILEKV